MNELGILHILLTVTAYCIYIFTFLKYTSKSYPIKLLHVANVLYITGFVLGMIWANIEWGYMLSFDSKIILSMLVPVPFVIESISKRKDWKLLALGCFLIILNYLFPLLVGTVHLHQLVTLS